MFQDEFKRAEICSHLHPADQVQDVFEDMFRHIQVPIGQSNHRREAFQEISTVLQFIITNYYWLSWCLQRKVKECLVP